MPGIYHTYGARRGSRPAGAESGGLDGWLLYDFHGSNPDRGASGGHRRTAKMTTRRWFYLIPRRASRGAGPRDRAAQPRPAAREDRLRRAAAAGCGADDALTGMKRVAMEYSPNARFPTCRASMPARSSWCAERGVEVVSSGDLVQRFEARLGRRTRSPRIARRPRRCIGSRIGRSS